MAYRIIGKIHFVSKPQINVNKNTNKTFTKRTLVLAVTRFNPVTGELLYTNYPSFEFNGDAIHRLDHFNLGDFVSVSFDLQGRLYTDDNNETKFFNTVKGFSVEPYTPQGGHKPATAEQLVNPNIPDAPGTPDAPETTQTIEIPF